MKGTSRRTRRAAAEIVVVLAVMAMIVATTVLPALAATAIIRYDLSVTKTDSQDPVAPGVPFEYIIEYENKGPSLARDVFLVDTLPDEVEYLSNDGGCTHVSGVIECSLGNLDPGRKGTVRITVQAKALVIGTFTNEVLIESRWVPPQGADLDVDDANPADNTDTEDTTVLPSTIGDRVWADDDADGVQDTGEAGITGVTVNLTGPTGPESAVTGADGIYLFTGLPAGDYTVAVDTATVPSGFTSATTPLSFDVALGTNVEDLDNDFGFHSPPPPPPPPPPEVIDLELTKTVAPGSVEVGEQAVFTLVLTNQGPNDATGVVVTDVLPSGLTLVGSTGDGTFDGSVWTVGDLAVGATVQLQVTVTVDGAGSFTNAAEVTEADQEDSDSTPGDGQGDDFDDAVVVATEVLASGIIGDFVWLDLDADGLQDAGEPGIAGAVVTLTGGSGGPASMTTNADGIYLFTALEAGTYTAMLDLSSVSSDLDLTTAGGFTIDLAEGESYLTADFGLVEVLPRTGWEAIPTAAAGILLVLAGAGALVLSRREP